MGVLVHLFPSRFSAAVVAFRGGQAPKQHCFFHVLLFDVWRDQADYEPDCRHNRMRGVSQRVCRLAVGRSQ